MPLNGTIKHGQNLLMVKFHVIHTSQLLKKKENGGGGTRQEEEEEERRQREPQRRCRFRGRSERARSAAGGPQEKGWRRTTARKGGPAAGAATLVPREGPVFHTEHGGGSHGHRTLVPAAVSGPSLRQHQRAPQHHYPPPSSHLPEQKGLAQLLGAVFVSQFLNLHFYYRKI